MSGYATIVADPPWPYRNTDLGATAKHRPNSYASDTAKASSALRYGSMSIEEIKKCQPQVADRAHLYLWTTNAFMQAAHDVVRAWGFQPKTILTWGKVCADDPAKPSMRMGYWFRGATEHVVFGVRGGLRLRCETPLPTLYLWPREAHSSKPDAFYDLVEAASYAPYLEMFARRARFGWDYVGVQSLGNALYGFTPASTDERNQERGALAANRAQRMEER